MKTELSLHNFITPLDTAVAMALVQGIGNYALSGMISAAQAECYARDKIERDAENPNSVDDRNDKDDSLLERDAPDGLENRETPHDRLKRYAPLYCACIDLADSYDAGEFDRPQDIAGHVLWRAGRPAADIERVKRGSVGLEEALRLTSNAKQQQMFWAKHKGEVISLCEDACHDNSDNEALIMLDGVDAVQAMIKGYGKLVDRIGNRKGSPYFTSNSEIGKTIRSDVGAMESALPKIKEFIGTLEKAYARQLLEAVNAGRNLSTIESQEGAVEARMKQRLEGLIAEIEKTDAAQKAVA